MVVAPTSRELADPCLSGAIALYNKYLTEVHAPLEDRNGLTGRLWSFARWQLWS